MFSLGFQGGDFFFSSDGVICVVCFGIFCFHIMPWVGGDIKDHLFPACLF